MKQILILILVISNQVFAQAKYDVKKVNDNAYILTELGLCIWLIVKGVNSADGKHEMQPQLKHAQRA